MKPISVLAAVASIAVLSTAACKKDEPVTSETNTTGAQIQPEQPMTEPVRPLPVEPQVPTTTGSATDTTTSDQSGMRQQKSGVMSGRDAGIASDFPTGGTDLIDRDQQYNQKGSNQGTNQSSAQGGQQGGQQGSVNAKEPNTSTSLGNGQSGESTGGKGTYGGKATWGTGPHKDTKMDQPSKK